jgi:hypothetical protein
MSQPVSLQPAQPSRRTHPAHWILALLLALVVGMSAGETLEALRERGMLGGTPQLGDTIALPGGSLRVDAAIPEVMAAMQHEKFARLGMNMSVMVPDSTPEGQQTIVLLVTIAGGDRGMALDLDQFMLSGDGMAPTQALRSDIGGLHIPAGSAINGTLVFRTPADADTLSLRYGDSAPIAIRLDSVEHHDEEAP